jgi:hypothetical protein
MSNVGGEPAHGAQSGAGGASAREPVPETALQVGHARTAVDGQQLDERSAARR